METSKSFKFRVGYKNFGKGRKKELGQIEAKKDQIISRIILK